MAQRKYLIPLKNKPVPLLTKHVGRTVMAGSQEEGAEQEPPGVMYIDNMLPTEYGFSSVHVRELNTDTALLGGEIIRFRGDEGGLFFLEVNSSMAVASSISGNFVTKSGWMDALSGQETITYGTVNGITYFYERSTRCTVYDESASTYLVTTLTGLTASNVRGILASNGYLIAYNETNINWSSTVDPTDFTPSSVTGAGGGAVAEIKGNILFCFPSSFGFLIYTEENIVSATYTGNAAYPFRFKEVAGSGGSFTGKNYLVAYSANYNKQFAYTSKGLQIIDGVTANNILQPITDYLEGGYREWFDYTNKAIVKDATVTITDNLVVSKITLIKNRFLVISIHTDSAGVNNNKHLIYDLELKQFGRINVSGTVFEGSRNSDTTNPNKGDGGFYLGSYRSLKTINLYDSNPGGTLLTNYNNVCVVGKLQYKNNRLLTLHEIEIEHSAGTNSISALTVLVSLDGKTISSTVTPTKILETTGITKYALRATGRNFLIAIESASTTLNTVLVTYALAGKR